MENNLRPLTLGEILDRTAELYRTIFLLFSGIFSVYAGALLALGMALIAIAQPEAEFIAQARPENLEQIFRAAAAQEMAGRRELLLTRLHEQGALTSSVLNQYLTVKEWAMV
jgi:hypothetical protein